MDNYNVFLSGKILEGYQLESVSADLGSIFKLPPEKVAMLLGGKTRKVGKNLSQESAEGLMDRLNSIGAQATMREVKAEITADIKKEDPSSQGHASQDEPAQTEIAKKDSAPEWAIVDDKPQAETVTPEKEEAGFACPKCGVSQEKSDTCVSCEIIFEKYLAIQAQRQELESEESPDGVGEDKDLDKNGMPIPFFGIGAGVLGAILWAGIAHLFGLELGILAWAIGGGVGVACVLTHANGGTAIGVFAAVITALAIFGGKFATVQMYLNADSGWQEEILVELDDEELMISYLADGIVATYELQGIPVDWPEHSDYEYAYEEADYPADIWSEAREDWEYMSSSERESYKQAIIDDVEYELTEAGTGVVAFGVLGSLGFFDIIFFIFGMGTAYQIANRGRG